MFSLCPWVSTGYSSFPPQTCSRLSGDYISLVWVRVNCLVYSYFSPTACWDWLLPIPHPILHACLSLKIKPTILGKCMKIFLTHAFNYCMSPYGTQSYSWHWLGHGFDTGCSVLCKCLLTKFTPQEPTKSELCCTLSQQTVYWGRGLRPISWNTQTAFLCWKSYWSNLEEKKTVKGAPLVIIVSSQYHVNIKD